MPDKINDLLDTIFGRDAAEQDKLSKYHQALQQQQVAAQQAMLQAQQAQLYNQHVLQAQGLGNMPTWTTTTLGTVLPGTAGLTSGYTQYPNTIGGQFQNQMPYPPSPAQQPGVWGTLPAVQDYECHLHGKLTLQDLSLIQNPFGINPGATSHLYCSRCLQTAIKVINLSPIIGEEPVAKEASKEKDLIDAILDRPAEKVAAHHLESYP